MTICGSFTHFSDLLAICLVFQVKFFINMSGYSSFCGHSDGNKRLLRPSGFETPLPPQYALILPNYPPLIWPPMSLELPIVPRLLTNVYTMAISLGQEMGRDWTKTKLSQGS